MKKDEITTNSLPGSFILMRGRRKCFSLSPSTVKSWRTRRAFDGMAFGMLHENTNKIETESGRTLPC